MTEKCLIGNPQHDLSGTLFTRCFWYTIVSVLTPTVSSLVVRFARTAADISQGKPCLFPLAPAGFTSATS